MSTPPEDRVEDFSLTPAKNPAMSQGRNFTPKAKPAPVENSKTPDNKKNPLISPPISPWMEKNYKQGQNSQERGPVADKHDRDLPDPVLFADKRNRNVSEEPLFSSQPKASVDQVIKEHHTMQMTLVKNKLMIPTVEEYRQAVEFKSLLGIQYNRAPGAFAKRGLEEEGKEYHQAKRLCASAGTKATPVPIAPAPRVGKRAIERVTPKPKATSSRAKRTPKTPSPLTKLMGHSPKGRSETPDGVSAQKRKDNDYLALPDYAPPTSTLPSNNPKCLKVEWPGSRGKVEEDKDRYLLHEAELYLASILRLDCAVYLTSKRRIFEARLNALRINKTFKKTDAQIICNIDVNKASRLWEAFEKVGWFDPAHFEKYL